MTNVGYTIIMNELYNERECLGVALGVKPSSFPNVTGEEFQYVTWEYRMDPGQPVSFFWGHYINHKDEAYADYHERLMGEYKKHVTWREESEEREG